MDSFNYWRETAFANPSAQLLAAEIQLDLFDPKGSPHGFKGGLVYPLRRLVVSGKDIPENMAILFGPTWENDMKRDWKRSRMEVLCAGPRSGSYIGLMDDGYTGWTPRPPTAEEAALMKRPNDVLRVLSGMRDDD